MKKKLLLVAVSGLLAAGCNDKSKSNISTDTNSSGGSLVTAPVDYLEAAGKAQQRAAATVDTTALNQAIQLFYTEKGRFPKELNELVTEKFIPKIPEGPYGTRIEYDAATGTVRVVKQ